MIKLLKHLKTQEYFFVVVIFIFVITQTWLDLKMPAYMNAITQIAQGGINEKTGLSYQFSDIWLNGSYMMLCSLGSMICAIITSYFAMKIAANFSARLRELLYCKVQGFSMTETHHFNIASLITRTTNDTQQVQLLIVMGLQMMIKAPLTAIWTIIKISGSQWQWSAAVALAVCFMLTCIIMILFLVIKRYIKIQTLTDSMNRATREHLSGLRIIRAYNAENFQKNKFEEINKEFTNSSLFTGQITALLSPIITLSTNSVPLIIYWIGAVIISGAGINEVWAIFGDMIVFMSYGSQIMGAFAILAIMFMILPRALVSANRISEVLETEEAVKDTPGAIDNSTEKGTVEFKNVSFKYPDAKDNVLFDISFKAAKGQTIALIGSTGCGKSTIVNLIPRFYDTTNGSVFVDGHNVKDYSKNELTKKLAYISQKPTIFSGDIHSNINFGDNDADETLMKQAIDISQSNDFIHTQENGTKALVSQNGSNFSGGQKQRLSIARAFARQAQIYIFDDTFSALDFKTDKELRKRLRLEMKDSTRIIVAQRIGTIVDADLILVIDNGKIIAQGTHRELLKNCRTYQEIAYSQLSEEELKNA